MLYAQLANLKDFRERLVDEESKKILDGYVYNLLNTDGDRLWRVIEETVWKNEITPDIDFQKYMENKDKKKLILFGAGNDGRKVKKLLDKMNMPPKYFCDNNSDLWGGKRIDGIEVINPEILNYKYRDHVIIISSRKYGDLFYKQLLSLLFPQDYIYYSRFGILRVNVGWQYFGLPYLKKENDEVFLDCGCLDGGSTFDFIKWCNGDYKKIYAFEPDKNNYLKCKNNLAALKKFELVNKGLWNEKATLHFTNNGSGSSKIDSNGSAEVEVSCIDGILKGEKATFIKMDIEGAELKALKGAENTIKSFYPKLAISVYHKWLDLIEIPEYLMRIAPEYNYAIRSHTSMFSEMVLYAWK